MTGQLPLFTTEIATPRNCYHCRFSDYHWRRVDKSFYCKRGIHHLKVRKLQKACPDYEPMARSARQCNCTACQKLLLRPL